nr:hypothetical protein [Tanacetum cinerariifolium]
MDMTIDQQVALDEALIPHASKLRIGKSNFRLRSDITSKESTLQLVYDVLRLTPFYKAFLVTADRKFWHSLDTLDTYGDTVTLKRRRDDADKDEEPSAGSDWGWSNYELMKGSCKSLVELEYFLEEVYKATIDQLDWNNPEGQQYPHNMLKPLPLIPNSRGHHVISFNHFINNDLEYLRGGASSRKYTTFVSKTKAADYEHIKWIEDLVPRTMWSQEPVRTLCFQRLSKNVHKKHRHLTAYGKSSTRCWQLPKEAQPHKSGYVPFRSQAQASLHRLLQSKRIFYQNKDKQNRLIRIDELHKFSDGTLNDFRTALDDCLKGIRIKYQPQTI